jgi:hypothetical protein
MTDSRRCGSWARHVLAGRSGATSVSHVCPRMLHPPETKTARRRGDLRAANHPPSRGGAERNQKLSLVPFYTELKIVQGSCRLRDHHDPSCRSASRSPSGSGPAAPRIQSAVAVPWSMAFGMPRFGGMMLSVVASQNGFDLD